MDDGFELLEQRVQKAAARLKDLQAENASLRSQLQSAVADGEKAAREAAAKAGAGGGPEGQRSQATERELAELRRERDEIRGRIRKLVELLDTLG